MPEVVKMLASLRLSTPTLSIGKENEYFSNSAGFRIVLPRGWVAEEKEDRGIERFYDKESQEIFEKEIERLKMENGGQIPIGVEYQTTSLPAISIGTYIKLPLDWIQSTHGDIETEIIQGRVWRSYYEPTIDTTIFVTGSGTSAIGFQFTNFGGRGSPVIRGNPIIREVLSSFLRVHSDNQDDWLDLTESRLVSGLLGERVQLLGGDIQAGDGVILLFEGIEYVFGGRLRLEEGLSFDFPATLQNDCDGVTHADRNLHCDRPAIPGRYIVRIYRDDIRNVVAQLTLMLDSLEWSK